MQIVWSEVVARDRWKDEDTPTTRFAFVLEDVKHHHPHTTMIWITRCILVACQVLKQRSSEWDRVRP